MKSARLANHALIVGHAAVAMLALAAGHVALPATPLPQWHVAAVGVSPVGQQPRRLPAARRAERALVE